MIPAEIVQVSLILLFAVLWLAQKERTRRATHALTAEQEKVRQLELENANLSGALADRSPLDSSGKGWTRPRQQS